MKRGRKCSLTLADCVTVSAHAYTPYILRDSSAIYMLFPRSIDSRLNTFGCDATRNVNKLVEFQAQKKTVRS